MEGEKSIRFTLSIVWVIMFALGILVAPGNCAEEKLFKVGPVKITPHPPNLEEKTVLFRWNGKYNGNKFLSPLGEMLTVHVKNVRIIRMWEVDPGTAVISKKMEISEQIASKMAKLKPDVVIAAQAD